MGISASLLSEMIKPQDWHSAIASLIYLMAPTLKVAWTGNALIEAVLQWENCFARSMISQVGGS